MTQKTREDRLAAAMYDRSVLGLSHEDAPPWLALPADDRDVWCDLARFALDAAEALRSEDAAEEAFDIEGHLRQELDARYSAELGHWRSATERLERELTDAQADASAVNALRQLIAGGAIVLHDGEIALPEEAGFWCPALGDDEGRLIRRLLGAQLSEVDE